MKKINCNWEVLALARFILALVVVLTHMRLTFRDEYHTEPWFTKIGAFEAVLGFLLISGLSIGKSIQRDQSLFLKRRLQRIYPIYVVSILLYYAINPQPLSLNLLFIVLLNLIFLNQIFTISFVGVAWSLSVEVWLYALAPFLRKLSFKVLMLIIYVSFVAFLFHFAGRTKFHWQYYSGLNYGINLLLLSFIWMSGFVYALYPEKRKFIALNTATFYVVFVALGAVIKLLSDEKHHNIQVFFRRDLIFIGIQFLCLVFGYVVVFFNHLVVNLSIGAKRLFNLLGNISYPLYLTHPTILLFLHKNKISNPMVAFLCITSTAFVVYWLFDFYSKNRANREFEKEKELLLIAEPLSV